MTGGTFRPIPFAITIAIHLALFAVLLLTPAQPRVPPPTTAMAVFDVPAPPAAATARATAPKPVPPPPPAPGPPAAARVAVPEPPARQASAGACDLTAPVQAALRASAAVTAGVRARRPATAGDVSSATTAIMLWNAGWIDDPTRLDPAAFAAIRTVVAETIAAAPPACREQPQGGPRLLIVPGAGDTVVLALGSGRWRWQDILDTARAPHDAGPAPLEPSVARFIAPPGTIS